MNSRIRTSFYIFFLNPVYVAAFSLGSLRRNKVIHCNYYYYAAVKTICMLKIQLKGTQGAKAWPVLRLVKLEIKGSVQLKSKVKI